MPLYEYECLSCGYVSEVIQRMSDDPLSTCDRCGGELKKLLSAPAFKFKGSGWYVTDYADKSDANGGSGTKGSKAASDSKSDDAAKSEKSSAETPKPEARTKSERIMSDPYGAVQSSFPLPFCLNTGGVCA